MFVGRERELKKLNNMYILFWYRFVRPNALLL